MMIELSEVTLEAQFHASTIGDSPTLILSHPHPVYGGTMKNKVVDQIYRRSVERNWNVFRYNTRGFGKSSGSFDKGIGEEKDLDEIVKWVANQSSVNVHRIWLIGYSFGSWITAKIASKWKVPCMLIAPPVSMYAFPNLDFDQPKIIFSAQKDELISFDETLAFAETISEPKLHVPILGADHYFIGTTSLLIREVFKQLDAFNKGLF